MASERRIIQCWVGDLAYALDMRWVRGVQRFEKLMLTSKAGPAASGEGAGLPTGQPVGWLPQAQGELPVYRLADLLGISGGLVSAVWTPAGNERLERIVLLEAPGALQPSWGMLVDAVSQAVRVEAGRVESIESIAVEGIRATFSGMLRLSEQTVLMLAPSFLFPGLAGSSLDEGAEPGVMKGGGAQPPTRSAAGSTSQLPDEPQARKLRGQRRMLIFELPGCAGEAASYLFGLSISQVPEILGVQPVVPLPGAPAFVHGLLNWRERTLPLLDLGLFLGLRSRALTRPDKNVRIIIARDTRPLKRLPAAGGRQPREAGAGSHAEAVLVGLVATADLSVVQVDRRVLKTVSSLPFAGECIRAAVEYEGRTLLFPDLGRIASRGISPGVDDLRREHGLQRKPGSS